MKKMFVATALVLCLGGYASAQSTQSTTDQTVTKAEEKGYYAKAKKKDRKAERRLKRTKAEDIKLAVPVPDASSTQPPKKEEE